MQNRLDYGRNYMTKETPAWIKVPFNIIFALVITASLLVAIMSCVYIRTDVIGPSMQPTVNTFWTYENQICDKVLINRLIKGERGDIIVIEKEDELSINPHVIKRLIAVDGDKITIKKETSIEGLSTIVTYAIYLIKAGESEPEKVEDGFYDMAQTYTKFNALKISGKWQFEDIAGTEYLIIPKDYIFYLGDNRNHSEDCSSYGPVKRASVIGKVVLIMPKGEDAFKKCFYYYVECIETWFKNLFKRTAT